MKQAKFSIGQLVTVDSQELRGVIIDVDAEFSLSDESFNQLQRPAEIETQPWYKILVDGQSNAAYIAEPNLLDDDCKDEVDNPMIYDFFSDFKEGSYVSNQYTS